MRTSRKTHGAHQCLGDPIVAGIEEKIATWTFPTKSNCFDVSHDVGKGGETVFPSAEEDPRRKTPKPDDLSECAKKGIAVKPKKEMHFSSSACIPNANTDVMSLHGGCPVLEGEKWSATKWIHVGLV
ncbi:putative procollagen-proline 4-dioxygenase [Helianthus annuus]|nr:putative procollagen-proline 4-dioxygenase [Helianthus annuus]